MTNKPEEKPTNSKEVAWWDNEGGAPESGDRSTRKCRRGPSTAKSFITSNTARIEDRPPIDAKAAEGSAKRH
jgi:hypothetical protein